VGPARNRVARTGELRHSSQARQGYADIAHDLHEQARRSSKWRCRQERMASSMTATAVSPAAAPRRRTKGCRAQGHFVGHHIGRDHRLRGPDRQRGKCHRRRRALSAATACSGSRLAGSAFWQLWDEPAPGENCSLASRWIHQTGATAPACRDAVLSMDRLCWPDASVPMESEAHEASRRQAVAADSALLRLCIFQCGPGHGRR